VIFTAMLSVRLALTSGVIERLFLGIGSLLGWGITGGFLEMPAERAGRLAIALMLLFALVVLIQLVSQQGASEHREPRGRRFIDPDQLRENRPTRYYK
jgi:hypothetical protein